MSNVRFEALKTAKEHSFAQVTPSSAEENGRVKDFFARARNVEFTAEGMSVEFSKNGPTTAPSSRSSSIRYACASYHRLNP